MSGDAPDNPVKVQPSWNLGTPPHSPGRTVAVTIDGSGYRLNRPLVDDLIARLTAAREETWPPPGPVVRRECPLPTCTWRHEAPDWPLSLAAVRMPSRDEVEDARTALGSSLDTSDPLAEANLANLLADHRRVEAELRAHFVSHPLEDWVLEVMRLQAGMAAANEKDMP